MTPEDRIGETFSVVGQGLTFTVDRLEGETFVTEGGAEISVETLEGRLASGDVVPADLLEGEV